MENGAKAENRKIDRKTENGPRPEIGKKWPKNWQTYGKMTPNPVFRRVWAISSPFQAVGRFVFSVNFFSHFWPVFHSKPGGLTRMSWGGVGVLQVRAEGSAQGTQLYKRNYDDRKSPEGQRHTNQRAPISTRCDMRFLPTRYRGNGLMVFP